MKPLFSNKSKRYDVQDENLKIQLSRNFWMIVPNSYRLLPFNDFNRWTTLIEVDISYEPAA